MTAETLMRSRYCAFVRKNESYLLASWHSSTRPDEIDLESDPVEWLGLTVVKTSDGRKGDTKGEVTFRARFEHQGETRESGELVERSRFVQEDGYWFYLDGELPQSGRVEKVGRNSPCPCGSGKNTNAVAAVEIGILAPTALTYPLNRAIVCLLLSGRKIGENVGQRNDYTLHVLIDD